MDRSAISKCLAKCLAFLAVNKPDTARLWFEELITELNKAGLGWTRQ